MDEILARKLSRQLRLLNALLVLFTLLILGALTAAGLLAYTAIKEVRDAKESLTSLQNKAQENLTLRDEICGADGTLGALVKNQTDICN